MTRKKAVSIWYFIGLLILVYGLLVLSAGIGELFSPSTVVLAELHVGIWWGVFLILVGAIYAYCFRPRKDV